MVNKFQFVNNLFIVVMQHMLYRNSKRTLVGWLKYWFTELLLFIMKVLFFAGFHQEHLRAFTRNFLKALAGLT